MKKIGRILSSLLVPAALLSACDDPSIEEYEPRAGVIRGTVLYLGGESRGDVIVLLYDADNLPPPEGTSRPVDFVVVTEEALFGDASADAAGDFSAPFIIPTVDAGEYQIRAFLDADKNFNPLYDPFSQTSQGDVAGGYLDLETQEFLTLEVKVDAFTDQNVLVTLARELPYDRPAFEIDDAPLANAGLPSPVFLRTHPIAQLGMDEESVKFPVFESGEDLDGDNFIDLYPRVVFTKIVGEGEPSVLVPGVVDPIPFLSTLRSGAAPLVPADELLVIVPKVAIMTMPDGSQTFLSSIPAGDYRTNVISGFGQTWSVPNDVEQVLSISDPTQSRPLVFEETELPSGSITGEINVLADLPEDDFSVVVIAFSAANPPPPAGSGGPLGTAIVSKAAFDGASASYAIGGLAAGDYLVRAFLDANDNFTPWFSTMNQPDAGDIGGGHLGQSGLVPVSVSNGPTTDIEVSIVPTLEVPQDRPVFALSSTTTLSASGGPVVVQLDAQVVDSPLLVQQGSFAVHWADLNRDGMADDLNGDQVPDVFPLVVAQRVKTDNPLELDTENPALIPGIIDPRQFIARGFPGMDPTATSTVVQTDRLLVAFPPIAVDETGAQMPPPAGVYRITVIGSSGQTWSIPNELARAVGSPLADTQSGALVVRP